LKYLIVVGGASDYISMMESAMYNRVGKDIIAYICQAAIDNGVRINYMNMPDCGIPFLLELGYITATDISRSISSVLPTAAIVIRPERGRIG
jgi:hypothetical protein